MKIKTLLISSAVVLPSVILVIASVVFFASRQTDQIAAQGSQAENVIEQVFQLNLFGQDVVLHSDEQRPKSQWDLQYNQLNDTLASPVFQQDPSRKFLPGLKADMDAVKRSFDVMSTQPSLPSGQASLMTELSGDLLVKLQRVITDADQLANADFQARSATRAQTDMLALTLLGLLALLVLGVILFIYRRIHGPIAELQRGVEVIAKGNLNAKAGRGGNDEIGVLAMAFNDMASKLKASYATLEEKVKDRTRELSDLSQKNELMLESIGDGVVAIDRAWNIILFNEAAAAISGWPKSQAMGMPFRKVIRFIREKDRVENVDFIEHAMVTKETTMMSNHTLLIRKDASEIPVGDSAAPILNDRGRVAGAIVIFRDATQERLSAMMRSDFAYASHQMRTPISQALWAIDSVRAQAGDQGTRDALAEAMRMVRSVSKICAELIDIAEVDQGHLIAKRSAVSVAELVKGMQKEVSPLAKTVGTSVRAEAIPKTLRLKSDRRLLDRCLREVLYNAVDYAPGGHVRIAVEAREQDIVIQVMDDGIGIREGDQPLVFTKFFRGGNVDTTKVIGAGLGLYLTREYLKLLGGKIWFTSEEGAGASFFLSIPRSG